MLDPKNTVNLTFGLVDTPETVNDGKIVKLRAAVDYAGQEKGSDNRSGYFDVTYFANDGNPNSKFVLSQVESGNFKKGTQLQLVGRLVQERWEKDGKKNSRAVIVAESISYAGGNRPAGDGAAKADDDSVELPTKF